MSDSVSPTRSLRRLRTWFVAGASIVIFIAAVGMSLFLPIWLTENPIGRTPAPSPDASLAASVIRPAIAPSQKTDEVPSEPIQAWQYVEDFPRPLAQLRSVFWEPRDTESLRKLIRDTALVRDKTVLEIGTGTGLVALCCLQAGARRLVATDVNAAAIASARYNAQLLELTDRLETRLVPLDRPTAFSVIGDDERFDLIISNPPWENRRPNGIDEFALYDEDFRLLDSLLRDLSRHLMPGGKALLAYGSVDAIRKVMDLAQKCHLKASILDDRPLDSLPAVFLPGMLIELRESPESRVQGQRSQRSEVKVQVAENVSTLVLALDSRL